MAITITNAANALKQYAIRYADQIAQPVRQGMEWEAVARPRQAYDSYVGATATATDLLQPFQCGFTPRGTINFDQVENRLQRIKFDFTLDCDDLEKFYSAWRAEWYEIHKKASEWSFEKYMWSEIILPKLIEEQNYLYYNGVYAAPTPPTPGALVDSMTGLKKKIADAITAATQIPTPINTGALTAANMVAAVELMQNSLPAPLQKAGGYFLMSMTRANQYWANYRDLYGAGVGMVGNDNPGSAVDNSSKRVVGLASMAGSDRIIYCPDIIWGKRIGEPYIPAPVIVEDIRQLKISLVYHRFIGVESFANCYVNNQA